MKRFIVIFLTSLLSLCAVSAQTEAIDSMLSIQTDTAYLHTTVRDVSTYKARLLGRLRLLETVEAFMPGRFREEAIVPFIKEINVTSSGRLTMFFYLKKSDLTQGVAGTAPAVGTPAPVVPATEQKPVKPAAAVPDVVRNVSFAFTPESEVKVARRYMENAITALLNAVNTAYRNNTVPDVDGLDMTPDCRKSLLMGWKHKPYYCTEARNVKPCLYASDNNMNVRDIPVYSPNDEDHIRQLSISFNRQGLIECVRFAAELASYEKIMSNGGKEITEATDIARRTSILSFVENYRNYYINMDADKIEQVFADDAIIISGSVITKAVRQADSRKVEIQKKVKYSRKSKGEYIASLRALFNNQKEVNVVFDDIKVVQDPNKKDIYGVTLVQHWTSRSKLEKEYSDVGYLFLLWDFHEPEKPMIHVRTWQPKEGVKTEDDIFSLNSFRY